MTPGQKLKEIRKQKKLTQIDLAKKARCSPSTIALMEMDDRGWCWIKRIKAIAKALGMDEMSFLSEILERGNP